MISCFEQQKPNYLQQAKQRAAAAGYSLETAEADLEQSPSSLPEGPFTAIGNANFLVRPLVPVMIDRLAPGGVLGMVVATTTNLERNPHPSARFCVAPGELRQLLLAHGGVELLHNSEAWRENGRHEAHCVVRRQVAGAASL